MRDRLMGGASADGRGRSGGVGPAGTMSENMRGMNGLGGERVREREGWAANRNLSSNIGKLNYDLRLDGLETELYCPCESFIPVIFSGNARFAVHRLRSLWYGEE